VYKGGSAGEKELLTLRFTDDESAEVVAMTPLPLNKRDGLAMIF